MIIVAKAKMHDRCGNAMGVDLSRIHRDVVPVVGSDFAPTAKGQISRLHSPHLLFEGSSITWEPGSLVRKHVTGIVDLKTPTADVVGFAKELVVARHIDVIGGAILVGGLLAFELL